MHNVKYFCSFRFHLFYRLRDFWETNIRMYKPSVSTQIFSVVNPVLFRICDCRQRTALLR